MKLFKKLYSYNVNKKGFNKIVIGKDHITKLFCKQSLYFFLIHFILGFITHKQISNTTERYLQEKRKVIALKSLYPNTPKLLDYNDKNLWLCYSKLNLTCVKDILTNKNIPPTKKKSLIFQCFQLLGKIHNKISNHGGAILKNFFIAKNKIYTCDFEGERNIKQSKTFDIMMLSADIIRNTNITCLEVLDLIKQPFVKYKFDIRDIFYFKYILEMPEEFFKFFGQ